MANFVDIHHGGLTETINTDNIDRLFPPLRNNKGTINHFCVKVLFGGGNEIDYVFLDDEIGKIEAQALYDKLRGKKDNSYLEEEFNKVVEKQNNIRQHVLHLLGFNAGIYNRTGKFRGVNYGGEYLSPTTIAHDNIDIANDILNLLNSSNVSFEDMLKEIESDIETKDPKYNGDINFIHTFSQDYFNNLPDLPDPTKLQLESDSLKNKDNIEPNEPYPGYIKSLETTIRTGTERIHSLEKQLEERRSICESFIDDWYKMVTPYKQKLDKITEYIDHCYKRIHSDIKAPKDIYIAAILQIKDILEDKG